MKRFNRYADGDEKDSILDEGIEQFYTELGVDTQVGSFRVFCPLLFCLPPSYRIMLTFQEGILSEPILHRFNQRRYW